MAETLHFKGGFLRAVGRLFVWGWAAVLFAAGLLGDRLRGRLTARQRGRRLRLTFETLGPTFRKVGQQMSVRADLLSYETCEELAALLDRSPPMAWEDASAAIERATGAPLDDTFALIDQEPVGSASLACVYPAVLHTGEKVAVKVRRPGIGPAMVADLRILGWFLTVAELLGFTRPRGTQHLRVELRSMLLEELDFRREARFIEVFRRDMRKGRQHYVTAPKVHYDLSTDEVLVTRFVEAVPMTEILRAVDTQDDIALSRLRLLGIKPKKAAQRMLRAWYFESLEGLVFHADPHPANVFVEPGGRLVFVDFGSCGRITEKTRRLMRHTQEALLANDVSSLVRSTVAMMEPLPPIDVASFSKELEQIFWDYVYALRSKHAAWWEKASGFTWLKFAALARKWDIPANLDTLRMFRATFVYDTVAFRLDPDLDPSQVYKRYLRDVHSRRVRRWSKEARRNPMKRLERELVKNENDQALAKVEALDRAVEMNADMHTFALSAGKQSDVGRVLIDAVAAALMITTVVTLVMWAKLDGSFGGALKHTVRNEPLQGVLFLVGLLAILRIRARLKDVKT
ncbi:MAG: AarF/ABC1/UbiB kinase family protein [Deltaproteobacteria bacterium]|nr:AarF/ABC1/UbiB kinase family protein [Deltaproteobacteria bacterium]